MTRIKDVAAEAGVSTATVSRVMADKPHVSAEARERVLAAIEKLDYRPNRVARSLRVMTSSTIGLIVSDIQNPFFTSVSRAVEDIAHEQGMSVFLCNSDEDPAKENMYLNLMRDEHVAGVILSPTRATAENFGESVGVGLPMVVIDRKVRGAEIDSVFIDNVEAAYRLVEHLISDGYRRIGALFGGSGTGWDRREGYLKALKDHGIKAVNELIRPVNAREEEGYRATGQLLALAEPPDAIFTSNALLSAGAFRALRESGLAIGRQIGFAGFDETIWTTLVEPPVTVIRQPTYEIGQAAIELLLKRLEEPNRPTREVVLKGTLVVRGSCGCGGG